MAGLALNVRLGFVVIGEGHGGYVLMAGLGGSAHGARIENVGTDVGTGVDAAHDDVRLFFKKHGKRELHAVRRRAVDAEAVEVVLIEGIGPQRLEDRERVPDAGLLAHGRNHVHRVPA